MWHVPTYALTCPANRHTHASSPESDTNHCPTDSDAHIHPTDKHTCTTLAVDYLSYTGTRMNRGQNGT